MMRYYPVMLDIKDKKCLVVGGGNVALRKIKTLLSYGAEIRVISPKLHEELHNYKITWINKTFEEHDVNDEFLVFAATNSREVNQKVAKIAREKGIIANVADDPALCDFIVPAILEHDDLTIAISTNGKDPARAKKMKEELVEYLKDK